MDWDIFKNKKILVTGHTGFKGSWLIRWLSLLGARVVGISKDIPTYPSNYEVIRSSTKFKDIRLDILDRELLKERISEIRPDMIFHLAAQSIVKESLDNPYETIDINVMGSLNILEACYELNSKICILMITSDKCYRNRSDRRAFIESDELGGKDPYSASKAAADLLIQSVYSAYSISRKDIFKLAICRAGNVIGGGDWSNARLIPDCISKWNLKEPVLLRSPESIRPWQHVLDSLGGYLVLMERINKVDSLNGQPFNFGPRQNAELTVEKLVNKLSKLWGENANYQQISSSFEEMRFLNLDSSKAKKILNWESVLSLDETINFTIDWYKLYFQNDIEKLLCLSDQQIKFTQEKLS